MEIIAENVSLGPGAGESDALSGDYVAIRVRPAGSKHDQRSASDSTSHPPSELAGLINVQRILAEEDGRIVVEREPDGGMMLTLYLPALRESNRGLTQEQLLPGSGRILVMDDDNALCAVAKQVLEHLGYNVETVEDGARAIAAFKRAKASGRDFDAALLDLDIPGGMGGVETAGHLKELDASVKVIATTGRSDSPVLSALHAHGFDDFAAKPWTPGADQQDFPAGFVAEGSPHANQVNPPRRLRLGPFAVAVARVIFCSL